MSEPADPKIGQLAQGRYRIVRKLGEGGMGFVYEGKHELIGRRVAIKTLHAHFAHTPELVERFHREANAATAIGNEHIIEVTDFGFFEDRAPFLVMELLEGVELGALLDREQSLPISRVVHVGLQVCNALAAAHGRGIVHRDMKPENIFLIRRGQDPDFVKVLDFGISKVRTGAEDLKGGLTKTGMALGTPYYMPPEQAQGLRDIDQRADIYAVGVILYRALAGQLPFDAESYPALMLKIMTETPPAIRTLRADVPEALERVVQRAMAKDREQRFQRIEDLGLSLEPFAALTQRPTMISQPAPKPGNATTPFAVEGPKSVAPPTQRGTMAPADSGVAKLAIGIGGALALLSLGIAAWSMTQRGPSAESATPSLSSASAPASAAAIPGSSPAAPGLAIAAQPPAAPSARLGAAAEVRVRFSATPKEARIFVAGAEFPNPTDASRPRSLDPVRIRVEAPGYQALEQLAIFDQDRELAFALQKGHGTRELSSLPARGAPVRPPSGAPPEVAAPAPAAPPERAAPEPAAPAAEPARPDGIYKGPSGKLREDF